jgi:hypothetical protein
MSVKGDAYRFLLGFDYRTDPLVEGPYRLTDWKLAPDKHGIYEIGFGSTKADFRPKYLGKAEDQTLCKRLSQHCRRSSNEEVRKRVDRLYFTCRPIEGKVGNAGAVINTIEGVYIAAFRETYEWNGRNEWSEHWCVEDLSDV